MESLVLDSQPPTWLCGRCSQKKGQGFEVQSLTGKCLFTIKGLNISGKKKIEAILFDRKEETEETSLKFSNLASEELLLWREGHPSHFLQYELSFWSDFAKWWMLLQEEEKSYVLAFKREEQKLPHWIEMRFPSVSASFYIAEVNWPHLIPSLSMVKSSLPVYEFQQHKIEAIRYDIERRCFLIQSTPLKEQIRASSSEFFSEEAIPVGGDWVFLPDKGFFPSQIDPIFNRPEISEEKVGSVLKKHSHIIEKYLMGTKIYPTSVKANYHLFFDNQENLHICCYVFEKDDLMQKNSAYFGPWVYVDRKGFYLLENLLFNGIEKIISREHMSDFINRHRAWLNGFEGFQTHIYAIESQLNYMVREDGFLVFEAVLDLTDIANEYIDFKDWVYLKGKGFFAKKLGKTAVSFRTGLPIDPADISTFIRVHKEELEFIKGFFSKRSPLKKSGVEISLNAAGSIVVRPNFSFYPHYESISVRMFGDYTYVEKEGFCEISSDQRLPASFLQERTIGPEDEPYFVLYELDILRPFITFIQKELRKPTYLSLRILSMKKWEKTKTSEWIMQALFETDVGAVPLFEIWKAITENKRYLFSDAGLIVLRAPRFNWLKSIPKRHWVKEGKFLKLSTLDWLRLSVLEEVLLPKGQSPEESQTKYYIETLLSFKTEESIDLSGFASELRSYQKVGVRWLYFLCTHGLSGLLCDEMGLGKTHQAMGLLAAVKNRSEEVKFLVVCPTSVIYHWEDLLKKFLPNIRVTVFYGAGPALKALKKMRISCSLPMAHCAVKNKPFVKLLLISRSSMSCKLPKIHILKRIKL